MPKLKSHSGAKKRFKLTKNGKVKRSHSNTNHFFIHKTKKQKRNLRKAGYADASLVSTIKKMIPYN